MAGGAKSSDEEEETIAIGAKEESRDEGFNFGNILNKIGDIGRRNTMGAADVSDESFKVEEKEEISTLEGATITAYSTSLFQRIRLQDGINFKRVKKSLNPSKNRD